MHKKAPPLEFFLEEEKPKEKVWRPSDEIEMPKNRIVHDSRGYNKYVYASKAMTPKMKILASLVSLGMKQREIFDIVKKKNTGQYLDHVCRSTKDDRVVAQAEENLEEMVGEAKKIIKRASTQAAKNFKDAVNDGDIKASEKVLEYCGAFQRNANVNVQMNFGSWLKATQEDRSIDVTPKDDD